MVLKLYNTLTKKKEIFKPVKKGEVKMYLCGPTVNGVPHLGHARNQISFDVLRKYLEFSGYKVTFVSNITDIEDKIIEKANEEGISVKELSEKNLKEHMEDYAQLRIKKPDIQPRATKYVKDMIDLIKRLEEKGYTYIVKNDGVYYDVSKFKNYGKLSGIDLSELKSKRKLRSDKGVGKRDEKDFVLWKFSKKGEPSWDAPWGKGRPGWHIECSAMNYAILGLPIDIHAGGQDLIFPHHEDEIAQAEAGYGKKFVNYWVHNGMVNVNKEKMSKSLGNFKTIKEILKKFSGLMIRYFVINNHYRKPIDFSEDKLIEAQTSLERLKNLCLNLKDDGKENKEYIIKFEKEMNNDLNTAGALNVLWKLVRDDKAQGKIKTIEKIDEIFGLELLKKEKIKLSQIDLKLSGSRCIAKREKNYEEADRLRKELQKRGHLVIDEKDKFFVNGVEFKI